MDKVKIVVQDPDEVEATTRKFGGKRAAANGIIALISHPPNVLACL